MSDLARIAEIYDIKNCPRDDGGRLRDQGEIADYPEGGLQRFFSCSQCGRWWTVIELKRLHRSGAVFRG